MILCVCPNPSIDTYWWLDTISNGGVNRVSKQEPFPGGKGIHVALNIAEMGVDVKLLGIWAGNNGNWIKNECQKRDISCGGITIEGENRTCITVMSENKDIKNTEFLETGPTINAAEYDAFLTVFKENLKESSIVVLSGSWAKGCPKDAYGTFIDAANEQNIPVWIDCSGALLKEALLHKPFGVHVNKDEAIELAGDFTSSKPYFMNYVTQLALTAGKEGLYFISKEVEFHAVFHVEDVVSTVGCGDALLAGIVVASYQNKPFETIARYGAAFGAANCKRADLGMIYKKDVEELLKNVC